MRARLFLVLSLIVSVWVSGVSADEATIRKNLTTRLPSLAPIDEISKTPLANLWEVRVGSEIMTAAQVEQKLGEINFTL